MQKRNSVNYGNIYVNQKAANHKEVRRFDVGVQTLRPIETC